MVVSEAGASRSIPPPSWRRRNSRNTTCPSLGCVHRPAVCGTLAELVKIDPKAIGVGQYQHDMPQKRLTEALEAVVEDCVNAVGGGRQHRLPQSSGPGSRPECHHSPEHVAYRGGKRPLYRPEAAAEGAQAGGQRPSAVRRLPAGAGEPGCWTTPGSILNPYPAAEQLLQLLGLRKGESLAGLCQRWMPWAGSRRLPPAAWAFPPCGHGPGAGKAWPGPPAGAARSPSPPGCDGNPGSEAWDGSHRDGAQCD